MPTPRSALDAPARPTAAGARRHDRVPRRGGVLAWLAWAAPAACAAVFGGGASVRAADFYLALDRPPWAPPAWLFGPAWTVLYLLMATAAWLAWRERDRTDVRPALALWLVQLVPNGLWTWCFFVWRSGAWATVDVVVLLALIVATLVAMARVRRAAAVLLLPYLAWVSFAAALTVAVWRRNPALL